MAKCVYKKSKINNSPKVIIGIPIYNEEKHIETTIESAINQTYENTEIIISDNCSSDRSYEIAQQYPKKYSNIKVIKHKENIGAANNFKYLLEISNS